MGQMDQHIPLTRSLGLRRLEDSLPRIGSLYAANRNTDAGPDGKATTTALSPFLRRRLLLEEEVAAAALEAHGPQQAGKFVDEVFWRTYFKGYLETHPSAWTGYCDAVAVERERLAGNAGLRRVYDAAVLGTTGIEGFDDWARELVETGWLHNHARMWFASIWVFTLRLPWVLGADFFMQHLLDGDPASNTLSWRWVAGLHTRGKHYVARSENIRRFTDGRFSPDGLNESPEALEEADPPRAVPLAPADRAPSGDVALLLHLDDLHPESLELGSAKIVRVGGLVAHAANASEAVKQADRQAMADALERAGRRFGCEAGAVSSGWEDGLPMVAAWAPVGPSSGALPEGCLRVRRPWDDLVWPRSTRGYFQVKSAVPEIVRALSLV